MEGEPKQPELFEPGASLSQLMKDLVAQLLKLAVHFSKQLNTKVCNNVTSLESYRQLIIWWMLHGLNLLDAYYKHVPLHMWGKLHAHT